FRLADGPITLQTDDHRGDGMQPLAGAAKEYPVQVAGALVCDRERDCADHIEQVHAPDLGTAGLLAVGNSQRLGQGAHQGARQPLSCRPQAISTVVSLLFSDAHAGAEILPPARRTNLAALIAAMPVLSMLAPELGC